MAKMICIAPTKPVSKKKYEETKYPRSTEASTMLPPRKKTILTTDHLPERKKRFIKEGVKRQKAYREGFRFFLYRKWEGIL